MGIKDIQLTRECLSNFTFYLTGGSTDPQSVGLPADLAGERFNAKLWMKYIIGSVAILGSVDECALRVLHGPLGNSGIYYLSELSERLAKKNDCDTVACFIARSAEKHYWDWGFGDLMIELVDNDWDTVRPLFERVLAILKNKDKTEEYGSILKRMPVGLQYEMIRSGRVPLGEIDRVYISDKPPHSLLRQIFFRARYSRNPDPQIREYIAERVPWFRQFMPGDIPSEARDTCISSSVEPSHDVWTRICRFMDAGTLIFVWPLVCRSWNRSYSKILTEDMKVHQWLLQDLNSVSLREIHTVAPWNHFLNESNSAVYLGQCILNGALDRAELSRQSYKEVREYLYDAMRDKAIVPKAGKEGTTYESFVKLFEEAYKTYTREMPTLNRPYFFTDKEHERAIHHLVCRKKLVVRLTGWWFINNISQIYSILGKDQLLVQKVIELSTYDYREALFIWIMIGQACGMAEDTARLVFNKPGIFVEKFIRPVVIKPSEYYDFIADSGMLFEMLNIYYKATAYSQPSLMFCAMYELNCLITSLILFFRRKPDKIEKIIASMSSQLSTLHEQVLCSMTRQFGIESLDILVKYDKYPPEDIEFVKEVLMRCGLLNRATA